MHSLAVKLILQRIAISLLTLLFVSVAVFLITGLLPSDLAEDLLGQAVTPEAAAALRETLGLDGSPLQRYVSWMTGFLQGDLGMSLVSQRPIADLIRERLPNSVTLAAITMALTIPFALSLGILAAVYRGSWFDRAASAMAVLLISIPEFVIATVTVIIFAVWLRWLPALSFSPDADSIWEVLRAYAMPVGVLVLSSCSQMIRLSRAAVIDTLKTSYIENATLKGARRWRLVFRHALPNAVAPIVNSIALSMSSLLGGVIIIETIFNYPGLAKLMVDAVTSRDMPLIQTCAMLFTGFYLILITAADIIAILSNPRLTDR
ncbi:ABC transporter permease [Pseudooceanicola nanhaiensis]|uniref:ABC transporter permease n=1 Tax=Pseudooceanicola nanhaiensis TaxID=375761 RepID=UPI001CD50474|nr:ABC transporter permease [Pseudooceanicola nanhaiensis]MCA0920817.1 ABC transporter permease [Pseudooceanicola nanhaiensis]